MIEGFKPLLAATAELDKIRFPAMISPKLDGIRCLVHSGVGYSRSLKPIPNAYVQSVFASGLYDGLDGELIVGPANAEDVYRVTNSGVMSKDGEPDFTFHVFDSWRYDGESFNARLGYANDQALRLQATPSPRVEIVPHTLVESLDELHEVEAEWLELGYEGVMGRAINGGYKNGRSTVKDGILWKLKRFVDAEYKVVGFEERMHNGNEAFTDELGRTKRSSHQENKRGRGDLGALVLETDDGQQFNCGTGFDDATRAAIWANREHYLGRLAKVKSFLIGVKDLPRFPVFLGFRDERDL